MKSITEVQEHYENRADKLERRVENKITGWITEHYGPGREQSLKGKTFMKSSVYHFLSSKTFLNKIKNLFRLIDATFKIKDVGN